MVSQFRGKAARYVETCVAPMLFRHQTATGRAEYIQKVVNGWRAFELAHERELVPTPYFFEALDYVQKAKKLQKASLNGKKTPKVGDPLMEAVPIYNTVERRYAGFSNVPELLWYGWNAPKIERSQELFVKGVFPTMPKVGWRQVIDTKPMVTDWLFVTLAHRITGSGASFEWDHGFRNNRIVEMACRGGSPEEMGRWLADYDGPIFTSIGNQIPPFPPCGGREYLKVIAPEFTTRVATTLTEMARILGRPMAIKPAVDTVLSIHKSLGCKQFKFVLTAWVMDMAEYLPHLVDPNSDVYHGKNAIEAMNICFDRLPSMKLQDFYDTATRLFADVTGTKPMDVEDASPGCDFVRWIESYVPKKGYQHVIDQGIYNCSSLVWHKGRQPHAKQT